MENDSVYAFLVGLNKDLDEVMIEAYMFFYFLFWNLSIFFELGVIKYIVRVNLGYVKTLNHSSKYKEYYRSFTKHR